VIGQDARGEHADGIAPEGFDHVVLERLEASVLVQGRILPTDRFRAWYACPSCAFREGPGIGSRVPKSGGLSILAAPLFPVPAVRGVGAIGSRSERAGSLGSFLHRVLIAQWTAANIAIGQPGLSLVSPESGEPDDPSPLYHVRHLCEVSQV
jgi:hypothetical protein